MKKNGKKRWACMLAMILAVSLCILPDSAQATPKVKIKKVKITKVGKSITMRVGQSRKLSVNVKVTPNKAKYKKVTYASSKKKVATVSSKGKITAKSVGTAKITVVSKKNKKKKATVKVVVKKEESKKPIAQSSTPFPTQVPTAEPTTVPTSTSEPTSTPTETPTKEPDGSTSLSRKPYAEAAYIGETLADVTIADGLFLDSNGNEIVGEYTWAAPETVLQKEGRKSYEAMFQPKDKAFKTVTNIYITVLTSKKRVVITELPKAGGFSGTTTLSAAKLTGGVAKDDAGNVVEGTFAWTDGTVLPTKLGYSNFDVTFTPTKSDTYRKVTCQVQARVMGVLADSSQMDKELDLGDTTLKNTTAYTTAWGGSIYNLSNYISGLDMSRYTAVELGVRIYDTNGTLLTDTNKGSAGIKLANEDLNWAGFVNVYNVSSKATLSLDGYTGGGLYLVVQNSTASIGYIEVTSIKLTTQSLSNVQDGSSLVNAFEGIFGKVGTALCRPQLTSDIMNLVKKQYNGYTMGNEMKPDYILGSSAKLQSTNPTGYVDTSKFTYAYKDNQYPVIDMDAIDSYIKTAYKNGMKLRYHVFVWHAQSPQWFFKEGFSKSGAYVSAEVMSGRLEYLIRNVMTHINDLQDENGTYIGREVIDSYDVANEYFHNFDKGYKSYWDEVYYPEYEYSKKKHSGILNPVYIKQAFMIADSILRSYDMRDDVSLLSNDFNCYMIADDIVSMVQYINTKDEINATGEQICDGVGLQTHLNLTFPTVDGVKAAVDKFKNAGFEIQVTEADLTDYTNSQESQAKQILYWRNLMRMFMEQKDSGAKITGFTWWGLGDDSSWRSDGVPLLFSDNKTAKEHYFAVQETVSNYNQNLEDSE